MWCRPEPNSFKGLALRLPPEKLALLQLAGVDMAPGSLHDWLRLAHAAASFTIGADLSLPDEAAAGNRLGALAADSMALAASNGGPAQAVSVIQHSADVPAPRAFPEEEEPDLAGYGPSQPRAADPAQDSETPLPRFGATSWHVLTAAAASRGPVSALAVRRWILVQMALVEEGRLTHAQLRYMAVLGALAAADHPSSNAWLAPRCCNSSACNVAWHPSHHIHPDCCGAPKELWC